MLVKQIYDQYLIPPNLQKHMLRVAALSLILSENWKKGKLDKEPIVLACVFHDMANIIKFDFNKPLLFKEEENKIDYWKKIQKEVIQKYGTNVHLATFKICREIGLPQKVLDIIKKLDWNNTLKILENQDYESVIPIYGDMRIGPFGIMLLQDRIDNLATRNNKFDFHILKKAAETLEETLQKNLSINLNGITNPQLENRFDELLKLEI
ncbi:hypothetical protein HYU94_03725 [Candidatus Daviesbacteria bacterium]|nr:hypothetical protein [Candidatus Daviesbacteria bacterium]